MGLFFQIARVKGILAVYIVYLQTFRGVNNRLVGLKLFFVMDRIIKEINASFATEGAEIPDFRAGDTLEVHLRIKERNKERIQKFEGVVVEKRHKQNGGGMVRLCKKVSQETDVRLILPLSSPKIAKIIVKRRAARHGRAKWSHLLKPKR